MTKFLNNNPTHSIKITWCLSHCNIKGNKRADELTKEATQLMWNAPIHTSREFVLHQAKASTQSAWISDRQKAPARAGLQSPTGSSHSSTPQNTSLHLQQDAKP
jgi:hypothetical protein